MSGDAVTTKNKVDLYESTSGVFAGLLSEMRELSKKKADASLSKSKVKILNRVLGDLLIALADEPEAKFLELLDDDDLPQNSDAVLVMVQFRSALEAFRRRYHEGSFAGGYWRTEERTNRVYGGDQSLASDSDDEEPL